MSFREVGVVSPPEDVRHGVAHNSAQGHGVRALMRAG
jgi:hypothetical protein